MGFTVTRPGGTKDIDFEAYGRLLRQNGVDLGKAPRVPDPATERRWLYVWQDEAEAKAFARELTKRTGKPAWKVVEVNDQPSEGPLGPLHIQLARRGDGLHFGVHPLSLALIQSAFPGTLGVTDIFIDTETWYAFLKTKGDLKDFVGKIAPVLTGLTVEQLESLGFVVIDDHTEDTVAFAPPSVAALMHDAPAQPVIREHLSSSPTNRRSDL